jgi:hypothetical protein
MAYERRYLQQTQGRTYSAGTPGTAGTPDTNREYWRPVRVSAPGFSSQLAVANQMGYRFSRSSPTGFEERVVETIPGTPGTPGTMQQARLRRGETAGGALRLNMAQGKRSLRIEPTELGQLPGRDLPPPSADSYDPMDSSISESLAGLRRRRGPQLDLSINASNAATGLNTL